ncbi:septum formation initiator family protein [Salinithrix halophila]|uniref:Septum formation initiator family protein n=1 Tax=Salinithrix halophila TaxID=1485204 RepID=A0ABV8J9G4_9BACL
MNKGSPANVVSIRSSRSSQPGQDKKPPRALHPGVRRRRWIWLLLMLTFFIWSGVELWGQSQRIEAREAALAVKQKQLVQLKKRQAALKKEIQLLQDEAYLDELARKMGYRKLNEEVYDLPDQP